MQTSHTNQKTVILGPWVGYKLEKTVIKRANGSMGGYTDPSLHSGIATDQRGIAPKVTLGSPPTLSKTERAKNWRFRKKLEQN